MALIHVGYASAYLLPTTHTHTTGHRQTLTFIHSLSSDFLIQFHPLILVRRLILLNEKESFVATLKDGMNVEVQSVDGK